MPLGQSETKVRIISEDWKKTDLDKAKTMHVEAAVAGLVLPLLFALA